MERLNYYFPGLTEHQQAQFAALEGVYRYWNERINVVSRQDLDNLTERHVLHSLGIAKVMPFKSMTEILDVGTGGGFPGIPLAILFPECNFHLIDSIGKKITVVKEVAAALELKNVRAEKLRAEQAPNHAYDFVVSRAVTKLLPLYDWVRSKVHGNQFNTLANGMLCLKGGDLTEERQELRRKTQSFSLAKHFSEEFFETKQVIHVPFF